MIECLFEGRLFTWFISSIIRLSIEPYKTKSTPFALDIELSTTAGSKSIICVFSDTPSVSNELSKFTPNERMVAKAAYPFSNVSVFAFVPLGFGL